MLKIAASILLFLGSVAYGQSPKLCGTPFADTALTRPVLSGPVSYVVSLAGTDSSTESVAGIISGAAEEARAVYQSLGWLLPPSDTGTDRHILIAVNTDTVITVNPVFSYTATTVPSAVQPSTTR